MTLNAVERFLVTGLWALLAANIVFALVNLAVGSAEGVAYNGIGAAVAGACLFARAMLR